MEFLTRANFPSSSQEIGQVHQVLRLAVAHWESWGWPWKMAVEWDLYGVYNVI